MNAAVATLCTERPVSSTERARLFAKEVAARAKSAEPSPPPSLAASFHGVTDTTLTGELVDLHAHLDGFEDRLREPLVRQIVDASAATSGDLYDLRRELQALRPAPSA